MSVVAALRRDDPPGRGAPGRRRVPRAEREPQMVSAAMRVFAERGFHGASMDEIAELAGITKPMLYSYFGSKEALFVRCQRDSGEQLRRILAEAGRARDLPPAERLWRALVGVFDFIDEHRDGWTVYHAVTPASGGPIEASAAHARDEFGDLVAELLSANAAEQGMSPELQAHVPALAHALTGATISVSVWWLRHPEEPKELQALRVMNFAWMGFGDLLEGRLFLPLAS
jgi:AcrR family transcriptional regulator